MIRPGSIFALLTLLVIMPIAGCGERGPDDAPFIPPDPADTAEALHDESGEESATEAAGLEEQAEEAPDDSAEAGDRQAPVFGPPSPSDVLADDEPSPATFGARMAAGLRAIGAFLGKAIFLLVLPMAIAAALLGMPGAVLVLVSTLVFAAFHSWQVPAPWVMLILVGLTVLAESSEYALTFAGVKRSGATNTTGVWTMIGGLTGAVIGGILAPIMAGIGALAGPVGWVILSVIPPIGFALAGGFSGGYLYELRRGKSPEEARIAGLGALFGRLAGSFTKALLVSVMVAIVLISTWGAIF